MKNLWTQSEQNIFVAAHRGWSTKYPENTMEAFRAAAALGVDQIETDIRVTADGELVIIHDETVDRTTDGTGLVREHTLAQLMALDAGIKKGEQFRGCRIPTFVEFLDFISTLPDMTVDFELKEYPTAGREAEAYALCDRVLALIDRYGITERCVVNTFSGKLHEYIQDKYGSRYSRHTYFPQCCLGDGLTRDPYEGAYCACVFDTEKASFDFIRSQGVQPWVGASVKDEATVDWAIAMGAQLITCNNPDVILELLRAKGRHA